MKWKILSKHSSVQKGEKKKKLTELQNILQITEAAVWSYIFYRLAGLKNSKIFPGKIRGKVLFKALFNEKIPLQMFSGEFSQTFQNSNFYNTWQLQDPLGSWNEHKHKT